eukprot:Lithocolla_globosa_v1_NODE_212_length_5135_cov_9.322047.p1 type:complete len:436 gc:universal NODE_212_length_5135_cov_9.322047:1895-3202(+)
MTKYGHLLLETKRRESSEIDYQVDPRVRQIGINSQQGDTSFWFYWPYTFDESLAARWLESAGWDFNYDQNDWRRGHIPPTRNPLAKGFFPISHELGQTSRSSSTSSLSSLTTNEDLDDTSNELELEEEKEQEEYVEYATQIREYTYPPGHHVWNRLFQDQHEESGFHQEGLKAYIESLRQFGPCKWKIGEDPLCLLESVLVSCPEDCQEEMEQQWRFLEESFGGVFISNNDRREYEDVLSYCIGRKVLFRTISEETNFSNSSWKRGSIVDWYEEDYEGPMCFELQLESKSTKQQEQEIRLFSSENKSEILIISPKRGQSVGHISLPCTPPLFPLSGLIVTQPQMRWEFYGSDDNSRNNIYSYMGRTKVTKKQVLLNQRQQRQRRKEVLEMTLRMCAQYGEGWPHINDHVISLITGWVLTFEKQRGYSVRALLFTW